MARKFKVSAVLDAEDRASATVGRVESRFRRFGNFLTARFAVGIVGVTAAIAGLVRGLRAVVTAAQAQEDAVNRLNAALAPLGDRADGVSQSLQEQAAALQQVTKFGDETIIEGQALIASFNRNEEAIKQATVAALDLASATGQNLQSAFLLLGRAAAGETSTLSRYGIVLDESIPKSERFAAAVAKINEQFGGQAQAQVDTFTGRIAQLSNAWGDQLEVVGDALIKNERISNSIESLTTSLTENSRALAKTVGLFTEFGIVLARVVTGPLRTLGGLIVDAVSALGLLADETEIVVGRQESMEATAKRLGFSVKELDRRLAEARKQTAELGAEMKEGAEDAATHSEALKTNAEAAKETADSYRDAVESVKAFGAVTSVQLEAQILEITAALVQQRDILGEHSREYLKLEEVATQKIESLRARIESLRDGYGDLNDTLGIVVGTHDDFSDSLTRSAAALDSETDAIARNTAAQRQNATTVSSSGALRDPSGLTPFQFGTGKFTFINGRRAQVFPDGRVVFP